MIREDSTRRYDCEELGRYMISRKCTIREVAAAKGMSKSTVHAVLTKLLPKCNSVLYKKVRKQLDTNKAERHIRGGEATKRKYQKMIQQK